MKTSRQLNIEDRSGYFFTNMTNILDFDPNLLDVHEIAFRDDRLIMYDISYVKKQNTFYLVFNNLDAVFQKDGDNTYLIFSLTEKNRIMLENYTEIFDEIAEQIQSITGDEINYTRDILKIKFKTSDDLPLNDVINIPL